MLLTLETAFEFVLCVGNGVVALPDSLESLHHEHLDRQLLSLIAITFMGRALFLWARWPAFLFAEAFESATSVFAGRVTSVQEFAEGEQATCKEVKLPSK